MVNLTFKNLLHNPWMLTGTIVTMAATTFLTISSVKSQSPSTIKVDGSSTVYPITEAVAEDFQKAKKGAIRVTVGVSGTGGGFKKFCAGETDISNASRPIRASEREQCKKAGISYIELPIAFDALTVVVNKQNKLNSITVTELKKMWEPEAKGKIMNWNQVNSSWPDAPLKLFGPGADSGTFDYFTEAINGKAKASRSDFTPSEDDNVLVQGVSRDKNALAYFGYAYYVANQNKLKALGIDNGKGAILPSPKTVVNNTYQPLSRPLFIYINAKAAQQSDIKQFMEFFLNNGPKFVSAVKYIPLPAKAYTIALGHFKNRKTGSVFVGRDVVDVTIDDILRLEAKE